ncbi:hypothetical protein D1871_02270 [Nakamurella silvestris]|nr:hypothetical protein D1871_02270 [Nakamurella silvestris]
MSTSFDDIALQQQRYTMDSEEAARQRAVLMAMVAGESTLLRRGRRRRSLVIAVAVAGIGLAGVGTAAALGVFSEKPADRSIAYCYGSTDLSEDASNRVEFAVGDASGTGDAAAQGLEICAIYWKSGVLSLESPTIDPTIIADPGGNAPVPPLTACIIPSGQLAVFPGGNAVCGSLGLPNAEV